MHVCLKGNAILCGITRQSSLQYITAKMTFARSMFKTESMFPVRTALLTLFRSNRGLPPFRSLKYLGTESFQDTYFDNVSSKRMLLKRDIRVRRREYDQSTARPLHQGDRGLEARKRIYGDHTHSIFMECKDIQNIRALIQDHLPSYSIGEENFGLEVLARFTITPEKFLIDEAFSLVLEHAEFGHISGKIAPLVENGTPARKRIDAFLKTYPWFCCGKGESSLAAYLKNFGPGERS